MSDLLRYVGGDVNDPLSYVLRCGSGACALELGRLGRFTPDEEGRRCVSCPCGLATVVDKDGQLLSVTTIEIARMVKEARSVG